MIDQLRTIYLPDVTTPCCGAGIVASFRVSEGRAGSAFCGGCLNDVNVIGLVWRWLPLSEAWRWEGPRVEAAQPEPLEALMSRMGERAVLESTMAMIEAHRETDAAPWPTPGDPALWDPRCQEPDSELLEMVQEFTLAAVRARADGIAAAVTEMYLRWFALCRLAAELSCRLA